LVDVSLNIKNEETHRLVRELAELTGQSQTSAVEDAVRRRIAELTAEQDAERSYRNILAIARQMRATMSPETLALDIDEFLYDPETGLPR
jgi:antitoxin VapB